MVVVVFATGAAVVDVVVVDVVVVGEEAAHLGVVMLSCISVTAPAPDACSPARRRPSTVTLSAREILAEARIVPPNVEPEPKVEELPTCQKTLQDCVPFIRLT
ncbi:MAG TPA: hypothetical protein VNF50_04720 [Acidimicrobiales bacterium]|nr:hypothetical protein [Acidimicrobiales bacterium]